MQSYHSQRATLLRHPDLLVVGGGVIGLSCALHIMDKDPDCRVAILDAPTNPGVASRAAAGMLAPLAEFHEDTPLFRLCLESYHYYPEFLSRFCPNGPAILETGILLPSSNGSVERARRIASFAARFGAVEELKADSLYREEPLLSGGRCTEALRVPGAIINPRQLHDALQAEARRRGVHFVQQRLRAVEFEGQLLTALLLDDESRIEPSAVLLATGAWSHHLGELFGLHLDVIPVKGQVARLDLPDGSLRHIVHEHHIYLAPRPGQGIVIGATMQEVGFSDAIERDVDRDLHRLATELAPSLAHVRIAESWIGFRPRHNSGEPMQGLAPRRENLLLALGHFRNGILLAPITGRRLAHEWDARWSRSQR